MKKQIKLLDCRDIDWYIDNKKVDYQITIIENGKVVDCIRLTKEECKVQYPDLIIELESNKLGLL